MTDAADIIKQNSALLADWAEGTVDSVRADEARAEIVAALDRLVAERDAERRARKAVEDVKADEVLRERSNLEAQIESLVAERDMARASRDDWERQAMGRGRVQHELLARAEAAEAERDRLREAATAVVHQYHLWSEDASDGTYALWEKDGLINAIIALRDAMGGHGLMLLVTRMCDVGRQSRSEQ